MHGSPLGPNSSDPGGIHGRDADGRVVRRIGGRSLRVADSARSEPQARRHSGRLEIPRVIGVAMNNYFKPWRMWRNPEFKKSYDVVIIGGGVHGLATAYELAKRGIKKVAV